MRSPGAARKSNGGIVSVVPFPIPKSQPGDGAREAMIEIMSKRAASCLGAFDAPAVTDYILALLWEAGFKVAPIDDGGRPAA